jgi:endonuclease-3
VQPRDASAAVIARRLLAAYPQPKVALAHSSPLELLIATLLSAQCTDERVNRVTPALFARYPQPANYASAPTEEVERLIRPTGYYRQKARIITACCRRIHEEHGGTVPQELEALTQLPGVGRKTANLIRGSAFGLPAIVVDTHVQRVTQRLGLTQARTPERIERELMQTLPEAIWTPFSLAAILHGRSVCGARRPRCSDCPLEDLCPWPDKGRFLGP